MQPDTLLSSRAWRPMSVTSQIFRLLGQHVNPNSASLFLLDGPVDESRLRLAAVNVAKRHPLLRSIACRRHLRMGWKMLSPPSPEDIRLSHYQLANLPRSELLEYIVNMTWEKHIPLTRKPAFFIQIFTSPSITALQIVTSHIAEDARANYEIANDLSEFYSNGDSGLSTTVNPPQPNIDRYMVSQMGGFRFRDLRSAAAGSIEDMLSSDHIYGTSKGKLNSPRGIVVQPVSSALLDGLKNFAHRHDTSVHATVLLALCRLIQIRSGITSRHLRLLDMFSIRAVAEPTCQALYENMVLPYTLRIRGGDDSAMLSQIRQKILQMKGGGFRAIWYRYAVANRLLQTVPMKGIRERLINRLVQANVMATNPGKIPYQFLKFGDSRVVDFFSYAQLFPPCDVMCQISYFRSQLRIIFLFNKDCFQQKFEDEFLAPLMRELNRIGDIGLNNKSIESVKTTSSITAE